MNLPNVRLSELVREAEEAQRLASLYLTENHLPSLWGSSGCGWQELWDRATYAGLYASCDGLLALAQRNPPSALSSNLKLFSDVFLLHICRFFDSAEDTEDNKLRLQCLEARTNNIKLAKFLQVSAMVGRLGLTPPSSATLEARQQLLQEGQILDGGWRACHKPGSHLSLSATVEVLTAFRVWLGRHPEDSDVLQSFTRGFRFLCRRLPSLKARSWRVVILWCLLETIATKQATVEPHLLDQFRADLLTPAAEGDEHAQEKFSTITDRTDYYTFNARFLRAAAHSRAAQLGIVQTSTLRLSLQLLVGLAQNIRNNGHYIPDGDRPVVFWESYQACMALGAFVEMVEATPSLLESTFMYIQPVHFETRSIVEDPKLAVVLMPFSPDWADDVFRSFRRAAERKEFTVWRSDLTHRDDRIMQTIWEQINKARFLVADCTGRNPNVFYELGIGHTLGKPVFICAQARDEIPFDLHAIRSVVYKPLPTSLRRLEKEIQKFIIEL